MTCKSRRVKCDQTHPYCNRCTKSGRSCGGYTVLSEVTGSKGKNCGEHAALSKATAYDVAQMSFSTSVSQLPWLRNGDVRTFDFFLSWTAPRLAGSLDKEFWCGHVLRIAQAEPLILDSLLAISTLYEHPQYLESFSQDTEPIEQPIGDGMKTPALQTGHSSEAVRPKLDPNHAKALVAYNRAIEAMRRAMTCGTATPLLALLSCTLFFCIEVIRDDVFAALALFSKGSELLKQFADTEFAGQEQGLVNTIKLMFARIGVLAAAFGHPNTMEQPALCVADGKHKEFANLEDARTSLYALMGDSHAFIQDAAAYKAASTGSAGRVRRDTVLYDGLRDAADHVRYEPARLPEQLDDAVDHMRSHSELTGNYDFPYNDYSLTPSLEDALPPVSSGNLPRGESKLCQSPRSMIHDLLDRQHDLEARLNRWYNAFLWARTPYPSTDQAAVSSLLMYYHVSSIWLTTRLTTPQLIFDDYTYHFEQVVKHGEVYINALTAQRPVFTFEVGAVPPLYFVATKCRIPSLRRKALQLLARAPRKECMWGATSTGQLAARIVAIEEENLGLPQTAWDGSSLYEGVPVSDAVLPAEEQRVHNLELLKNKVNGMHEVRVTRYLGTGSGRQAVVQDYPI